MRTHRIFKIPARALKTSLYLITATGVATLSFRCLRPNHLSSSADSTAAVAVDDVRAVLIGFVRSSRALFTIASNVIDYKLSLRGLSEDSDDYRRLLSEVHQRSAKRILKLCEANKGFYVKAGQFVAAVRQVPKEYSSTLVSLQDQAVPCQFQAIKKVLISNLGRDLSEIFLLLEEQPIAAASIAQVHRALLKDHREVAVKVQYPGLEQQLKIDIATMSILSKSVEWLFPVYRFQWLVSGFAETIALELDFIQEARNSERTAKNFKDNCIVRVPHVFWELTTNQVLTMEYCRGRKVDDLEFLKEIGVDGRKVAKALVEVFAEMIFVHGFVHGDPHPGNILVSPEGPNGFSLVLLDHGIYKRLDEEFRQNYCQLWKAMIFMDSKKIQQLGEHFGVAKYSKYFPLIFTGRTIDSKSALGRGMSAKEKKNLKQDLKLLNMEDISSFMESLPSDFLTVMRTDGLLRSLVSKLGASQRDRLLAYAKYALHGLSLNSHPELDSMLQVVFSGFKSRISYLQLRFLLEVLDFLSWMQGLNSSFMNILRKILVAVDYLARNLFWFSAITP